MLFGVGDERLGIGQGERERKIKQAAGVRARGDHGQARSDEQEPAFSCRSKLALVR